MLEGGKRATEVAAKAGVEVVRASKNDADMAKIVTSFAGVFMNNSLYAQSNRYDKDGGAERGAGTATGKQV